MFARLIAAGILLASSTSAAQPATDDKRPWAHGVSKEDRTEALREFRLANQLFGSKQYSQAATKYRRALRHWSHPSIQGNLGITLIHLDRPVAAYGLIEKALRFGANPFASHIYQQMLAHQKLLRGQVSHIVVDCQATAAAVTLDGAGLFDCPKSQSRVIRSGQHEIVARAKGHLTYTRRFVAAAGATTRIKVVLVPLEMAGGTARRFSSWKPWSIVGAGVGVLAIGLGFQLAAGSNTSSYEREVAQLCPDGCVPSELPETVRDLEGRGRWQNRLAIGAFIVGGVALVAGGGLVFVNQPKRVRVDESGRRIGVAPALFRDGAGLAISGRY